MTRHVAPPARRNRVWLRVEHITTQAAVCDRLEQRVHHGEILIRIVADQDQVDAGIERRDRPCAAPSRLKLTAPMLKSSVTRMPSCFHCRAAAL